MPEPDVLEVLLGVVDELVDELVDGLGDGLGVGVVEADVDGVGIGDLVTTGVITTPLSQSNFLPDLTQVNFFPAETAVVPAFVQAAPAFGVAATTAPPSEIANRSAKDRVAKRRGKLHFI